PHLAVVSTAARRIHRHRARGDPRTPDAAIPRLRRREPRALTDTGFSKTAGSRRRRSVLLKRPLQVEVDSDVLADQHAPGFESRVPREAEVLTVDRRRRRCTGLVVAVRVLAEAAELELEAHRLRDAADRQVAVDEEVAVLDPSAGGDEL